MTPEDKLKELNKNIKENLDKNIRRSRFGIIISVVAVIVGIINLFHILR
jgi:flagellar biosynthesis/type III secretory pathway M-ring protein FliF/YscJ